MNENQTHAINNFFTAVTSLKTKNVIRSDNHLGDIGEFICVEKYEIELCSNQREVGYDGKLSDGTKIQIKFNNSPTKTNIYAGNPDNYDFVYIILGKNSKMRKDIDSEADYICFIFSRSIVQMNFSQSHTTGKTRLNETEFEEINLTDLLSN